MILQSLLFPKEEICMEYPMFYRFDMDEARLDLKEKCLYLKENGQISSDTYFNSFSYDKWKKYTRIKNIFLVLQVKGRGEIELYQKNYRNNWVVEKKIKVKKFDCSEKQSFKIVLDNSDLLNGNLSFKINASGSLSLYGGYYGTDLKKEEKTDRVHFGEERQSVLNHVNIAINICTFMREKYVYRNMEILKKYIFDNEDCELRNRLKVFITDNGNSLDDKRLKQPWIHLVKQGDNGSAGGFTRGLIEILHDKDEYTNIIMMDDDVLIEPEAIIKNFVFLQLLKKKYKRSLIGGALLRTDYQNVQYICGGTWDTAKCYRMHKIGYDLNQYDCVLKNEIEDNPGVNGWWYCCMPSDVIRKDNLPWPSYFHMDDMEYDIRNSLNIILLNGICVWHEPFENKPSSYTKYYDTRNVIITHMVHFPNWRRIDMWRFIIRSVFAQVQNYRYKEAWIVIKALQDVLKGPDWIMKINPIEYLDQLIQSGYRKSFLEELDLHFDYVNYMNSQMYAEKGLKRLVRKATLNGHFLVPAKKKTAIVQMFGPHPGAIFGAKTVLNYDEITGKAYITEKSNAECLKLCFACFYYLIKTGSEFQSLKKAYKSKFPYMCTEEFWKTYLR